MDKDLYTAFYTSPTGVLEITADNTALQSIQFVAQSGLENENELTQKAKSQLAEYFAGTRKDFDLPLASNSTDFQQSVYFKVSEIPYGKTTSYSNLATDLGDIKKVRAVGTANGKNPLLIVIPCHRVIGASGDLVGYAGGLQKKEWLLRHEGFLNQLNLF